MLMQNSGVTNKEYYGMLWYFLEWSIQEIVAKVSFILEKKEYQLNDDNGELRGGGRGDSDIFFWLQ